MINLPNLTSKSELDELVYHLKGFVEAAEVIRAQIGVLDATIDSNPEAATDAMGRLRAEIYTHLAYHMKEMRRPFLRLFHDLCSDLEVESDFDTDSSKPG